MDNASLKRFGYKIVDRDFESVESILESAVEERRPIEIGLYFQDAPTHHRLRVFLEGAALPVITHLDHRKLSVYSHGRHQALLREQIEASLALGAGHAINHIAPYPMTPRPAYQGALMERLLSNLGSLNGFAQEYGLPIHIENSFHGIDFYRWVFRAIGELGLDHLHFCFDIGHAKVWSRESLLDWMGFMEGLGTGGVRLHFHLHANSGLMDEHLSLMEAERQGYGEPDDFTGHWGFHEALSRLDERFPAAHKIFEVPTDEALENMRLAMACIAEARGRDRQRGRDG